MNHFFNFQIHWKRIFYSLTGKCLEYEPIDVGGWCDNCGRNKLIHIKKGEQKMSWSKCPVCGGKGIVPNGFYNIDPYFQQMGTQSTVPPQPEKCRSCVNGLVNDSNVFSDWEKPFGDLATKAQNVASDVFASIKKHFEEK
jgi:hypothetical protein